MFKFSASLHQKIVYVTVLRYYGIVSSQSSANQRNFHKVLPVTGGTPLYPCSGELPFVSQMAGVVLESVFCLHFMEAYNFEL